MDMRRDSVDAPLVTLAVIAFNQSRFVAEAVEAALSQDYSPLEVIISDDCSTDDTFKIMKKAVDNYTGPHSIVLRRNHHNLNLGGHINVINRIANGELVVIAAGDDVSLSSRVSRLVDAWQKAGKQSGLLHSSCRVITESGEVLSEWGCRKLKSLGSVESAVADNAHVIGATEAWDRAMFNSYGDFRRDLVHEDVALTFRSLLAGRPVTYVDQPLVHYRMAVGITATYFGSSSRNTIARTKLLSRLRADTLQRLDDLKIIQNSRIEEMTVVALEKYDVALRFEQGMPTLGELIKLAKKVGFSYVVRMTVKRLINKWLDK